MIRKPWMQLLTTASGAVVLMFVPALALAWFSAGALHGLAAGRSEQAAPPLSVATRPLPEFAPPVLHDWTDTAGKIVTPNALGEATTEVQLLNQQLASLQTLHDQQTEPVRKGTLGVEITALRAGIDAYNASVANNPRAPDMLSPYGLAHAQSLVLHVQINLLRQAIGQVSNSASLTLLSQELNLKFQEATALDATYRNLTGQRAAPTTIFSSLLNLNAAINQATNTALAAQSQEIATGQLLPVTSSPFTFSSSQP